MSSSNLRELRAACTDAEHGIILYFDNCAAKHTAVLVLHLSRFEALREIALVAFDARTQGIRAYCTIEQTSSDPACADNQCAICSRSHWYIQNRR